MSAMSWFRRTSATRASLAPEPPLGVFVSSTDGMGAPWITTDGG